MNILLTNDDGIFSEGLYALYKEINKIANISVVAPDSERSSVGHGITLSKPIWYKKIYKNKIFFGHGINGTPADCVKFAFGVLHKKKIDVVLSGINLGGNDGCSVFYSGTVAGAREASLQGIPAIAVSLNTFVKPNYNYAAKYTARLLKTLIRNKIPRNSFLNVNIPNINRRLIRGTLFTKQCLVPIHTAFKKRKDPNYRDYYWMTGKMNVSKEDNSYDSYALKKGFITITPIQNDTTDYELLRTLKGWKL